MQTITFVDYHDPIPTAVHHTSIFDVVSGISNAHDNNYDPKAENTEIKVVYKIGPITLIVVEVRQDNKAPVLYFKSRYTSEWTRA